uniref:Uncharacterized protein n=1 Tax=Mus spicilegus TaxID=10103 RepID=A0A8C6N3U5_MUSSI
FKIFSSDSQASCPGFERLAVGSVSDSSAYGVVDGGRNNWFFRLLRKCDFPGC